MRLDVTDMGLVQCNTLTTIASGLQSQMMGVT